MPLRTRVVNVALFVTIAISALAQAPAAALLPTPRFCADDPSGNPLVGGLVYSYAAGTSTPLVTFADSTGAIANTNPVMLDSAGCASIWIGPQAYKIVLTDANNAQQWTVDNVSDVGQLLYNQAVLLFPAGGLLQTVAGPLGATFFTGTTPHLTSPGVRVGILDPLTILDSAVNPPSLQTLSPAAANQVYSIPDPLANASVVLSPNPANVNGTGNVLDCTQPGITCKRTAYTWFDGAGCNNATAGLGFDTFGANSPTPLCVTGSNVQKGVMGMPSAVTHIQQNSNTVAAGATVTVTYPAATLAGDFLVASVAFDGTHTITGCTDGTNAYTQAKHVANAALSADVWYFNGNSTAMAAASTLTCTFNAATSNAAIKWHAYRDALTAAMLDVTASNTGSGTAVTTGTTAGTAQNTELVFSFGGALTGPTMVGSNGYVDHGKVSQSTNVTVDDEGLIAQSVGTQSGAFTLGSSQTWAAGVVTFKANVAGTITAQRRVSLPAFYDSSRPVTAGVKWQTPLLPLGTVDVALGAAISCTADGATDDPAFNTPVTATPAINLSSANILTTTSLASLPATGCAPNNLMHFQVQRLRYNASDTYEGYVYVGGASLQFGITQ